MSPTPTTAAPTATQLHAASADLTAASGVDVNAEIDLLSATNRDMFSWLLFNSENISASLPNGGATAVNPAAIAAALSSHHQPLDSIDDPFRMLPHQDDTSLPLGMSIAAAPITTSALTTAMSSAASIVSTAGRTHTTTAAAPTAVAVKKRGKKRTVDGSPVVTPTGAAKSPVASSTTTTVPIASAAAATATAMPSTQGLLRHLQSANNAMLQKQAAADAAAEQAIKQEGSSSSGSETPDRMRKLKLERNRESARECRRRKREHIHGVEERCRQLERENMELRGQLKAGKEAMKQEEREKNRVCEELEKMIQCGASEKELAEKIDNFKEQYSDYGHGRRSALDYHLHQIERLLLPTQVTKMCIWALRQDDSFWHDDEDDTSLPVILARELGLSEEQKKKIQQQREPFLAICDNLKDALGLLNELKAQVASKNTTLDMEMDKLQNILTPTQRAKFIVWVTNNQACMHLLNKLWRSVL